MCPICFDILLNCVLYCSPSILCMQAYFSNKILNHSEIGALLCPFYSSYYGARVSTKIDLRVLSLGHLKYTWYCFLIDTW